MKKYLILTSLLSSTLLFCLSSAFSVKTTTDSTGSLGEVRYSVLDPTQFKQQNGNGWILMDGRDIPGTDLAALGFSKLPDVRGMFIRGMDMNIMNDPDGNRIVGSFQSDGFKSHSHQSSFTVTGDATNRFFCAVPNAQKEISGVQVGNAFSNDGTAGIARVSFAELIKINSTLTINNEGTTNETRPKNIALYVYIKINKK